jgi:uncharacterized protein (TIRG00374 family)
LILALAKLVVGACLLVLLGYLVDWGAVAAVLRRADLGWVAGAFLVSVIGVLLSAEKWNGLLRDNRIKLRFQTAMQLYWVGMFFSNFLPTSVGGDVMRLMLTPSHGRTERVAGTILIERLTGFFVMLVFSAIGLLIGPLSSGQQGPVIILLAAVLGLLGAVAAVLLAPTALIKLMPAVIERLPRFVRRLIRKMQRIVITVARQTRRGHALRRALLLSVPFYCTIFLAQYCVLQAVGADVRLSDVILVGSLVPLLSLVPISLNGIGLAEGVFVAVYGVVGVPPDAALAAALLRRLVDLANSALGGVFWLMEGRSQVALSQQQNAPQLHVLGGSPR